MLIPIEIASFALFGNNSIPVVIFRELGGKRTLAVPVDPYEASAIALATMTKSSAGAVDNHFASMLISRLGATLEKMVFSMHDVSHSNSKATLYLSQQGKIAVVCCKTGEAIVCSLLHKAPILAQEELMARNDFGDRKNPGKNGEHAVLSEGERIRQTIYNTDTAEFGRFYPE